MSASTLLDELKATSCPHNLRKSVLHLFVDFAPFQTSISLKRTYIKSYLKEAKKIQASTVRN